MNEDGVAWLRPEDTVDDQRRGEPFHQHRRRLPIGHGARQLEQAVGGNVADLRVRAGLLEELAAHPGIGDPIAGSDTRNAGTDALHHARRLVAQDHGKLQRPRDVEAAAAHIDIGIIDPDRGVPDARFAGAGRRKLAVLPAHHLGPAIGVDADGLGHSVTLAGSFSSSNTEMTGGVPLKPSSCQRATTLS